MVSAVIYKLSSPNVSAVAEGQKRVLDMEMKLSAESNKDGPVAAATDTGSKGRSRYTVELSAPLDERVARLADELDMSKADVIREAVRMLAEYDRFKREGYLAGAMKINHDGSKEFIRIAGSI